MALFTSGESLTGDLDPLPFLDCLASGTYADIEMKVLAALLFAVDFLLIPFADLFGEAFLPDINLE